MRISKITLHGFKSYLEKTELTGFDTQFNAITGLNGSGKSNILDAICFVLGQNAPSKFRVKTLGELVYKKGTGGINFASVVIEFDLTNSTKRPLYNGAEYAGDTLVVERKYILHNGLSKVTINGHNSTLTALHDMFRSVQLNILNPHFLIMQGRVTKVLSMRPPEIWSMVEEAAGTSVYRERRVITVRNIKAQEDSIRQVEETMRSNVEPKLAKVEQDENNKRSLMGKENECKRVERVHLAITYYNKQAERDSLRDEIEQLKQSIVDQESALEVLKSSHDQLVRQLQQLESTMTSTASAAAKLEQLTSSARQAKKDAAEVRSRLANKQSDLAEEDGQLQEIQHKVVSSDSQIAGAQKKLAELVQQREKHKERKAKVDAECTEAEARYLALQTGLATDQQSQSLDSQLEAMRNEKPELDHSVNLIKQQMSSTKSEVEKLTKQYERLRREHPNDAAQANRYAELNDELRQLQDEASLQPSLNEIDGQLAEFNTNLNGIVSAQRKIESTKRQVEGQISQFTFSYKDHNSRPIVVKEPTDKIYGTLAQLTRVRKPSEVAGAAVVDNNEEGDNNTSSHQNDAFFCCALETALGGALHNVVVDTAETARHLLDKCTLTRRTVIEPLDSLTSRNDTLSERHLQIAKEIREVGENNVWRAIDLVDYDPMYQLAVEKALGKVMICRTPLQANKVAYSSLHCRAVTLDGEVFNPTGEMTGGGRPGARQALAAVQKYYDIGSRVEKLTADTAALHAEIEKLKEKRTECAAKHDAVAAAERKLAQYRMRDAAGNELVSMTAQLTNLKQAYDDAQRQLTEKLERLDTVNAQIAALQEQIAAGGADRELNEAKKRWEHLNHQKDAAEKQLQVKEAAVNAQQAALTNLETELSASSQAITELEAKINAIREEIVTLTADAERAKHAAKAADAKVAELGLQQREEAAIIAKLRQKVTKCLDAWDTANKQLTEARQQQQAINAQRDGLKQSMRDMTVTYPWIATHVGSFGQAGTEFSFHNITAEQLASRLVTLRNEIKALELKTDRNDTRDSTEAKNRLVELRQKKERLQYDRENLLKVIEMLDNEREMIMNKTIEKTNEYFGKIFGTLLPNASARLERCDTTTEKRKQQNVTVEGLEIKVQLGRGGRINSLKELSGGQRSLVALSLILTLLKINPAPIYILDEIDAALDLSHTKNVGHMISKFFKQSQFIIVSLKQGMFTNANVLFEIFFRDGTSRFKRSTGGGAMGLLANGSGGNDEPSRQGNNMAPPKKVRAKKTLPLGESSTGNDSRVKQRRLHKKPSHNALVDAENATIVEDHSDDEYISAEE